MAPALHPPLPSQVFQRREDGSVNFFRGWEAYRDGFGKLTGEHWLGERPCAPQTGGLGEGALPRWVPVSSQVLPQKGISTFIVKEVQALPV